MLGSGGYSDGYKVGSKRPRMTESNPYFAVSGRHHQSYGGAFGGGHVGASRGFSAEGNGFADGSNSAYTFPVVRLRGLPFNCIDIDIFKFFAGLDVVDTLLVHKNGRFSGEAFVVFASPMQADFALQRDRQNMGRRYVEVFKCKKQEYYLAIAAEMHSSGACESEVHQISPPQRTKKAYDGSKDLMEHTEFLKLRGLPYSVRKSDIIDFFEDCELTEDDIHIVYRPDGKATGEAYVKFESAELAKKCMWKDRMTIGSRYVELFPSTPEEARKAESRSRQ